MKRYLFFQNEGKPVELIHINFIAILQKVFILRLKRITYVHFLSSQQTSLRQLCELVNFLLHKDMDDSVENMWDIFSAIYAEERRAFRTDMQGVEEWKKLR
jgi:hypothetical protein